MYGFDQDVAMMPASEGVMSIFDAVLKKIKETAENIKQFMRDLVAKIKRLTGRTNKDEALADSKQAIDTIKEIKESITSLLDDCCISIDKLYDAYKEVGQSKFVDITSDKAKDVDPGYSERVLEYKDGKSKNGYNDYSAAYKAHRGMDKIDKEVKNDSAKMAEWNKVKQELGEKFADAKAEAEKIASKLKSLRSFGPLTLSATKEGYNSLREIFDANGKFGADWKKIKIAAEWSTGAIREALNKVVSLYDVGVRATNAFGNRLTSGNFRAESGEKMSKEDRKAEISRQKNLAKVYADDKTRNNINVSRKDKNFYTYQSGETPKTGNEQASYVLDRIYQMAYEDAMEDIAARNAAMEAYDSVPGAYEFVEESVDPEFVLDPEYDLV